MNTTDTTIRFVFFGTPEFSVDILNELKQQNYLPTLIVSAPDKKVGRKQILQSPPVIQWAKDEYIPFIQTNNIEEYYEALNKINAHIFIVAAYGYLLSGKVLSLPKHGTLNVHTSLLPQYRGACPIESAILNGDTVTGSTIMLMDEKMDHGPIINQEVIPLKPHTNRIELFNILAEHGGNLLARTIRPWINGDIAAQEQDHKQASFCYKIQKSDGNISNDNDELRYKKYLAYYGWPGVFYFDENNKRVKVTKAHMEGKKFVIDRIIPEGKKEQEVQKKQGT